MKTYFYILYYSIISQISTSIQHSPKFYTQHTPKTCTSIRNTPKLCIHCKFYKKPNFTRQEFGKCSLFVMEKDNDNYFVTGKKENKTKYYYYCSTARNFDHLCGEEGKFYKQK